MDARDKLSLHLLQIKVKILHLPLGKILGQQSGSERTRIVEGRAPVEGKQLLIADLQYVAGLGAVDKDRPNNRMRTTPRIAHANLRQLVHRHAGLQLVQEVRPGVGKAYGVAGINLDDG